jgi:hypothetical protein
MDVLEDFDDEANLTHAQLIARDRYGAELQRYSSSYPSSLASGLLQCAAVGCTPKFSPFLPPFQSCSGR